MWFAVLFGVGLGVASLTVLSRYPGTPNKDLTHELGSDAEEDHDSDADDVATGKKPQQPSLSHATADTTASLRRRGNATDRKNPLNRPAIPGTTKDPRPSETLQQAVFGTSDPTVIQSAIASAHRQADKLVCCHDCV